MEAASRPALDSDLPALLKPLKLAQFRSQWQAAQDASAQPLLTMAEQKDLEKRHQQDQRQI